MVWACGKNGWVSYDQNCVDGEVSGGRIRGRPRLGWMDGVKVALGNRVMTVEAASQCVKDQKKECRTPVHFLTEWVSRCHFCLALYSFGPPSRALLVITWRRVGCRYMMRLGQTVKREQLLKINAQMSSIWAKECMLMIVRVLSDWTWLPLLGGWRKSWYIT